MKHDARIVHDRFGGAVPWHPRIFKVGRSKREAEFLANGRKSNDASLPRSGPSPALGWTLQSDLIGYLS